MRKIEKIPSKNLQSSPLNTKLETHNILNRLRLSLYIWNNSFFRLIFRGWILFIPEILLKWGKFKNPVQKSGPSLLYSKLETQNIFNRLRLYLSTRNTPFFVYTIWGIAPIHVEHSVKIRKINEKDEDRGIVFVDMRLGSIRKGHEKHWMTKAVNLLPYVCDIKVKN